jgi:hypothetical protein
LYRLYLLLQGEICTVYWFFKKLCAGLTERFAPDEDEGAAAWRRPKRKKIATVKSVDANKLVARGNDGGASPMFRTPGANGRRY